MTVLSVSELVAQSFAIRRDERMSALDQSSLDYMLRHRIEESFYLFNKATGLVLVVGAEMPESTLALITVYDSEESSWLTSWKTITPKGGRNLVSSGFLLSFMGLTETDIESQARPAIAFVTKYNMTCAYFIAGQATHKSLGVFYGSEKGAFPGALLADPHFLREMQSRLCDKQIISDDLITLYARPKGTDEVTRVCELDGTTYEVVDG